LCRDNSGKRRKDEEGAGDRDWEASGGDDTVQNDSRKLASEYTQQRVELEKRMAQVAEAAKKEAEIAEENHRRQIEELLEAFQQTSSSAESEREEIRRQLTEIQKQYEEVQSKRKGGRGILVNLPRILDAILNFLKIPSLLYAFLFLE
jgi:chromosome segregation ATPase